MKLLSFVAVCLISTGMLLSQDTEEKNEVTLKVKGMVCGACEDRVEKNVKKIEGVKSVKASHTEDNVRILIVSDEIPQKAIKQAIKESGFEVIREDKEKEKKKEKTREKETAFTLKVSGMMCGACENSVKRAVKAVKGVESVEASYKTGNVVVEYDSNVTTEDMVVEAINQTRFKVVTEDK